MRQIGTYTQAKIAFIVIGIVIMSALGGATLTYTHDMTATALALLTSGLGIAVFGRRALQWWWQEQMLGIRDRTTEETADYERTTRARNLAPKILRMVAKAQEPVTVMIVGTEPAPGDGRPDRWGKALRKAAAAGAAIRHYLPQWTTKEEAALARALADE